MNNSFTTIIYLNHLAFPESVSTWLTHCLYTSTGLVLILRFLSENNSSKFTYSSENLKFELGLVNFCHVLNRPFSNIFNPKHDFSIINKLTTPKLIWHISYYQPCRTYVFSVLEVLHDNVLYNLQSWQVSQRF